MRNRWGVGIAGFVLAAGLAAGCGNGEGEGAEHVSDVVTLTGCVQLGKGSSEYALNSVTIAPAAGLPEGERLPETTPVTEGSWVRLSMEDTRELQQLVGQRATVTGTVIDSGRDTIGTSGPANTPNPPPSDVPGRGGPRNPDPDEHHSEKVAEEAGPMGTQSLANGRAPEVAVLRISATGERCNAELRPERRR